LVFFIYILNRNNAYTLWAPEVLSTVTFSGQSFSKTLFLFAFTSWMSFLTFLSSLANSRFLETHLMTFFSASNCSVLLLSKVFRYAGLSSSLSFLICKFYHVQTTRKLEPIYNIDIKNEEFYIWISAFCKTGNFIYYFKDIDISSHISFIFSRSSVLRNPSNDIIHEQLFCPLVVRSFLMSLSPPPLFCM
jgi:hypothetical protein